MALLRRAGVLAVLLLAGPVEGAEADGRTATPTPTEYEVKAAFLYNFARFVEWPAESFRSPRDPFVITVLGRDPFGPVLDEVLAGKAVLGHPIDVRRAARVPDAQESHIVFVSASERARLGGILRGLARPGTLTVGDTEGFARSGGAINFRLQGNKVRFEINVRAAEQARLRMSSQLLKLATLVAGEVP